jgi:C_GCAxxG_C_C family probable redox protein
MTKEQVLEQFDKGYDCGQVVFQYWAQKLGLEDEIAYKVASGFGAGMFQGETCGAIIGAYMALGLKYGHSKPGKAGDEQRVESIIKNVQFRQNFLNKYDSTMCRDLLNADMSTAEGAKYIREKQLMNTFCPQLVADVIEILEEIM